MEIKRLYHRVLNDAGEPMRELVTDNQGNPVIDPETSVAKFRIKVMRDGDGNPIVRGVHVKRLPIRGKHKFSPRLIATGEAEGWLTFDGEEKLIVIKCEEHGQLVFQINRTPGRYCVHDGAWICSLEDDPTGAVCRRYIQEHYGGEMTPDNRRWPHGYEVVNAYETTLEDRDDG